MAKKVISQSSARKFSHELDQFDDVFEKAATYSIVAKQISEKLSPQEINHFSQYREARLSHLPLDLFKLAQKSTIEEEITIIYSNHIIDIPHPKETGASSSTQIEGQFPSYKLEEIWEQCSQVIKGNKLEVLKTPSQEKVLEISKTVEKTLFTVGASNKPLEVEDIKTIPKFLTFEVIIRVQ